MINSKFLKPAVIASVLGAIALVSFGSGFAVENWRKGAEVEKLRGKVAILEAARAQCSYDVEQANSAMHRLTQQARERERQAEEAMRLAEPIVKERTKVITQIKELPVIELDRQCEAIKEEQIKYVQSRR